METRGALFGSRAAAEQAVEALHKQGVDPKSIDLLMPGAKASEFEAKADVLHGQTGPGAWSAMGAGMGSFAGAALVTALIPGVGTVLGLGAMAAAFIAGGFGGKLAGDAIESSSLHDDYRDDTHLLYEALRHEKAIMIVKIEGNTDPKSVEGILSACGGQSFDEAREGWWRARRDSEAKWYEAQGLGSFDRAERAYRRGYQAGFQPANSGRSFEAIAVKLRTEFKDNDEADFRRGYERAQETMWNAQADASSPASSQSLPAGNSPREAVRVPTPSHPGG